MIKDIMKDPLFLAQKSTDATKADQQVVVDLLDTLRANLDHCVGMAANMIGVKKNIIVVAVGPFQFAMINFMLYDLCCPSRIFPMLLFKILVQIIYFYLLISLTRSHSIQR